MSTVPPPHGFRWFPREPEVLVARATWFLFACAIVFSLWKTVGRDENFQDGDYGAYFRAAASVSRGESPYGVDTVANAPFVYSPAVAYLFRPLVPFGYMGAARIWMLVNWALCAACVVLGVRLTRTEDDRTKMSWFVLWLALLPMLNFFWANVRVGQAGALMAASCLAWAVCRRVGRPFVGGLFLAFACGLKVAPLLLVPYLLVRRDWRGLTGVAVGGLAILALPALWVGPEGVVGLHREWVQETLREDLSQTYRPANQSFAGVFSRLPFVSNGSGWVEPDAIRSLLRIYPFFVVLVSAALYGWIWRDAKRGADRSRENLHLSLLLIWMTLSHPRAWSCNFAVLILPCLMLAGVVWGRAAGWKLALGALFLLTLGSRLPSLAPLGAEWSWGVWIVQSKYWWSALVAAAVCYRLRGSSAPILPLRVYSPSADSIAGVGTSGPSPTDEKRRAA